MNEPAVALTDFGLAVEGAILALLLRRGEPSRLRSSFIGFFAMLAVAALCGGLTHGFLERGTDAREAVWAVTLLAIGGTALAAYRAAGTLLPTPRLGRVASVLAAGYAIAVLVGVTTFTLAVAFYLPSVFLLLVAFSRERRRTTDPSTRKGLAMGIAGLLGTLVAAAVQQLRIGVHPQLFDHNALYHLIQAIALIGIYRAARCLTENPSPAP